MEILLLTVEKKTKINAKVVSVAIVIIISVFVMTFYGAKQYQGKMLDERKIAIKLQVDSVYELLEYYRNRVLAGGLSDTQAQIYARESIKRLSIDKENYYWVVNTDTKLLLHPINPEYNGKQMEGYAGPDGKHVFRLIVDLAQKKNEGFFEYMWQKPNSDDKAYYSKISYLKLYKPWGWIVGAGDYIDDIEHTLWNAVYIAGGIACVVLLFLMSLGMTIVESLRKR